MTAQAPLKENEHLHPESYYLKQIIRPKYATLEGSIKTTPPPTPGLMAALESPHAHKKSSQIH
ncbi:MAG: hypothetical protein K940chlam9_01451 [Chlamydiae bacterium]|nr:hypothetical protein [Chlamydiota bacterium]